MSIFSPKNIAPGNDSRIFVGRYEFNRCTFELGSYTKVVREGRLDIDIHFRFLNFNDFIFSFSHDDWDKPMMQSCIPMLEKWYFDTKGLIL